MADTFVKNPKVIYGPKDSVIAEMSENDFGIASDVEFYTKQEIDEASYITRDEYSDGASEINSELETKAGVDLLNITNDGRANISNVGMPSNVYTDLTLGASGNQYTAPADGWFVISKAAASAGQYLTLNNSTTRIGTSNDANAGGNVHCYVPARKGDKVSVSYNLTGSTNYFRFIYSEGAKHLA